MVIVMPTFLILAAAIIATITYLIIRISRSRNKPLPNPPPPETQQQIVREEVVKKEVIVKVRCSYCGSQYDETLDKCPNCGAIH
jgi:hypothetical protein